MPPPPTDDPPASSGTPGSDKRADLRQWRVHYDNASRLIADGDYVAGRSEAVSAAALAEALAGPAQLRACARLFFSVDAWHMQARLLARAEGLEIRDPLPEWNGEPFDGTLLVVERQPHVGRPLRYGRLLAETAKRVRKCIALVEPRLVPLFARSFPDVDIRKAGEDDAAAWSEGEAVTGYYSLVAHVGIDDDHLRSGFRPFVPDPRRVQELRARYAENGKPLIGVSWYSTSEVKVVPELPEWSGFLNSLDATRVSLQYGDVGKELTELEATTGCRVVFDACVDSLVDLDLYAAQVAAMDAVVTISSTCAHMAGSLAVPTLVLLDDMARPGWPNRGATSPWYPALRIVRHAGRPWQDVFAEIAAGLEAMGIGVRR